MHERPEEEDSGMLYDETSVELPPKPLPSLDNLSHTGSQKSSENDEDNDEDKGDVNYGKSTSMYSIHTLLIVKVH